MNCRTEIAKGLFICRNGTVPRGAQTPKICSYYEKDPATTEMKDCKYGRRSGIYFKCCPPHSVKHEMYLDARLEEL